jgi:hypothetical protein
LKEEGTSFFELRFGLYFPAIQKQKETQKWPFLKTTGGSG